jgi:polar amino acid transport system substrate-binding protein
MNRLLAVRRLATLALLVVLGVGWGSSPSTSAAAGAPTQAAAAGPPITVATKPIAPFVFVDDVGIRGYSIDLWNKIAVRLDRDTTFVPYAKVGEIVDAVEAGEADVAIAGISMTAERESRIDFSHAYFDAGLQVMVRNEGDGPWRTVLNRLASKQLLYPIIGFLILVVVMAHVMWLFERKRNSEHFPRTYRAGMWESFWWSIVTVTTGGDAEKTLTRGTGRILAMVWMLFGLFVVAYLTASVTSSLTVAELRTGVEGFADLPGKQVITVEGTVADTYLTELDIDHRVAADFDAAAADLLAGRSDAVVYDSPVLQYFASTEGRGQVSVVGEREKLDRYGIVLPQNSELREPINDLLLEFGADGTLDELYQKWFKPND